MPTSSGLRSPLLLSFLSFTRGNVLPNTTATKQMELEEKRAGARARAEAARAKARERVEQDMQQRQESAVRCALLLGGCCCLFFGAGRIQNFSFIDTVCTPLRVYGHYH